MQGAKYNAKRLLDEDGRTLNTGKRPHKIPLTQGYKPDLYTTDECDADHKSRYQQLIGILRWFVGLGRIDIQLEVAFMSQYEMNPREGNLEALYLIFNFLWKNPKKSQVMDSSNKMIHEIVFYSNANWV